MNQSESASFDYGELLVSRTDQRGVIQFANASFQRVAGFSAAELTNAPHKIVRHPEMPRAVFWLIWDRLLSGQPIGGFVKNKTKTGGFYWVFAVVTPLENGFMSMRILPGQETVATVEAIYAEIHEMERGQDVAPKESAEYLLKKIRELGYPGYEAFMSRMVAKELASRDRARDVQPDRHVASLLEVVDNWGQVGVECNKVFDVYETFGPTPSNMRVQASQLRENGIALSVISSNFAELANQINMGLTKFASSSESVELSIYDSLFLSSVTRLLKETEATLRAEGGVDATELTILSKQVEVFEQNARTRLQEVVARLRQFVDQTEMIKRELSGLSTTRVMCAIENAKINQPGGNSVASIIEDLQDFQNTADTSLLKIRSRLTSINRNINKSLRCS